MLTLQMHQLFLAKYACSFDLNSSRLSWSNSRVDVIVSNTLDRAVLLTTRKIMRKPSGSTVARLKRIRPVQLQLDWALHFAIIA